MTPTPEQAASPMERQADHPDVELKPRPTPAPGAVPVTVSKWRVLWLTQTWPIRRQWWKLLCMLNMHEWQAAVEPAADGSINGQMPTRYRRCKRPDCRIFGDKPQLVSVKGWIETDDFIILAKRNCRDCQGRGFRGTMRLPGNCRAKIPCGCLTIQPEFLEHIKDPTPSEKAKRRAAAKGVVVDGSRP